MNNEFKEQCANLNENDSFYFSIKENLTQKYEEDLEAIDMYNRKTENNNYKNNRIIQKIEDKIKSCDDLRKNLGIWNSTMPNLLLLNQLLSKMKQV